MKKFLHWCFINGTFAGLFVLGITLDKYGFILLGNILTVLILLAAILMLVLLLTEQTLKELIEDPALSESITKYRNSIKNEKLWFKILDPLYDVSILVFFMYYNLYFALTVYTIFILAQYTYRSAAKLN